MKRRPKCGSTMMHHVPQYVHSGIYLFLENHHAAWLGLPRGQPGSCCRAAATLGCNRNNTKVSTIPSSNCASRTFSFFMMEMLVQSQPGPHSAAFWRPQ